MEAHPTSALAVLDRVVAKMASGVARPGQRAMCAAVEQAINSQRHLVVEAGTGTGKSLAYLVPAILSGRRVVVATATKALQDQLVHKDIPFLQEHVGPFAAVVLKGRSNYVCRARLAALADPDQGRLEGVDPTDLTLVKIRAWVGGGAGGSGDRADLPMAVPGWLWQAVSVDARGCPGAQRCIHSTDCFSESARRDAATADVIVVNIHYYALHLASGGLLLPEHDVVIVDEAHQLEDIAASAFGVEIGAGRLEELARAARAVFTRDAGVVEQLLVVGNRLDNALAPLTGSRVDPRGGEIAPTLLGASETMARLNAQAAGLEAHGEAEAARLRLVSLFDAFRRDLQLAQVPDEQTVAWVEGSGAPVLKIAPLDVGPRLAHTLFHETTVICTSATLTVGGSFEAIESRLGLDDVEHETLAVGSPFAFEEQALLYCPVHLPDPRDPSYATAMHAELRSLIECAGGRTLALFTSRRACEEAANAIAPLVSYDILVQDSLPRQMLIERFMSDETSCLFATMGYWQGLDVPGRACSLVAIDRIPFPRPDEPLFQARRDVATRSKKSSFHSVDLPRAAMLLAQGAGRLIRTSEDRGVVAVLDRRFGKASYAWTLVNSLPPMTRTRRLDDVRQFFCENVAP